VRSLPTVKLFKEGAPVDEFMGVLPEEAVREFLEHHLEPQDNPGMEVVEKALESGDQPRAMEGLNKLLSDQPESDQIRLKLATLQADCGELDQSTDTLKFLTDVGKEESLYTSLLV
jgi:putative thioredoxin|tara:strand:- start:1514 stop:1861 length:348 start_codon:yes stop_codon:yes gene_type:complete